MKTASFLLAAATAVLSISGCASDGTKPDDMSAAEHRAAAEHDRSKAEQHAEEYDPHAISPRDPSSGDDIIYGVDDVYWPGEVYNPTAAHRSLAERHQDLAHAHEAAAKSLEQFEEGACKAFPAKTRPACPLLGPVASVEDIDGGVRLRLSEGFAVEPVAAHVRCHFAFARTQGYQGMDACPLFLKGLRVQEGEGVIDLLLDDESQLEELRKRARSHAGASN